MTTPRSDWDFMSDTPREDFFYDAGDWDFIDGTVEEFESSSDWDHIDR